MQCPIDGATLTMSERSGIEIDYCPTCRGVWLDRGELDKIIDRSLDLAPAPAVAAPAPAPAPPASVGYETYDPRRSDDREHRGYDRNSGHYKKKRKESWLSDLFD